MPISQGTGAQVPGTAGAPIGRVVRAPGGQAVVGAPQGGAVLLMRTTWTLGTTVPAGGGHRHVALAARPGQDIPSGGSDDTQQQ